jgi:DNA-binding LytR/AlgR family response regulator
MSAPNLRILAVEDNPLLARALRPIVADLGYELLPVAASAEEAVAFFDEHKPDLVLLDVRLRGSQDGIDVARQLNARRPVPLIFVTSFQDRDTFERAKSVGAFAFLIKPYDALVLERAIELAMQHFVRENGPAEAAAPAATEPDLMLQADSLFVRDGGKLTRVAFADILWVEADDSYCHLHTAKRKFTLRISLRDLEDQLPPNRFLRIHRGYLVQVAFIEQVDPHTNEIQLQNGQNLPIGRAYRADLLNRLHLVG